MGGNGSWHWSAVKTNCTKLLSPPLKICLGGPINRFARSPPSQESWLSWRYAEERGRIVTPLMRYCTYTYQKARPRCSISQITIAMFAYVLSSKLKRLKFSCSLLPCILSKPWPWFPPSKHALPDTLGLFIRSLTSSTAQLCTHLHHWAYQLSWTLIQEAWLFCYFFFPPSSQPPRFIAFLPFCFSLKLNKIVFELPLVFF